jgi:DNA-binding NarL/FixJ family response regulator
MENLIYVAPFGSLHVLLAGRASAANLALAGWLWELGGVVAAGPADTTADALTLAATFRPDVVLLDFHEPSIGHTVSLFKELEPAPKVFVLTHETSESMRHRCRAVHIDAVFHKTNELDQLSVALDALRPGVPL